MCFRMSSDEATAAFLASIDVVSLEFRRLVVELQQAGESTTRQDLRLLVAPMTAALRDMVSHAEAEDNAAGAGTSSGNQRNDAQQSKRRRLGAPVDVVGTGLGFFAHQRSVLFPGHSEQKRSEDSPSDTIQQLQGVLQQLERYQSRAFSDLSTPPLKIERPRRAGALGAHLHAECTGICTWTITFGQRRTEGGLGGGLHIDDVCAAGLDETRSCKQWFDDPARRAWYRSRHTVFASLSDAAMDAASHYAAVYSSEPGRGVLQTLIWLAHARTLFQEPCMICGRVLSRGEAAAAPTPPTSRHFETFRALHRHCR